MEFAVDAKISVLYIPSAALFFGGKSAQIADTCSRLLKWKKVLRRSTCIIDGTRTFELNRNRCIITIIAAVRNKREA